MLAKNRCQLFQRYFYVAKTYAISYTQGQLAGANPAVVPVQKGAIA
jgi:hypothetical protein